MTALSKFLLWRQVFVFQTLFYCFEPRSYYLIQDSAHVIWDDKEVALCSKYVTFHLKTSMCIHFWSKMKSHGPHLENTSDIISLTQCAETFPMQHLSWQTILVTVFCPARSIHFLDTVICDGSVVPMLQAMSNTFLFHSLKHFYHLNIVSLLITSGPQTSCNISDISILLSPSFAQNSTAHSALNKQDISAANKNLIKYFV